MTDCLLIGAGGHARVVVEAAHLSGDQIVAYADPNPQGWLSVSQVSEDSWVRDNPGGSCVIGLGGVKPDQLNSRLSILANCMALGLIAHRVIHPAAIVSPSAVIGDGAMVLVGAVINAGATIEKGVIVNSRAIVEHDSIIGEGSHIAPGAIILGGAKIGACCMIGAGAVVLPNAELPDNTMVPALTRRGTK